jgi:hypothetical protein
VHVSGVFGRLTGKRIVAVSLVAVAALGGSLVIEAMSSASAPSGSAPASGSPSSEPIAGDTTSQTFSAPGGQSVTVSRSVVTTGNIRYQYSENGQLLFGMQETSSCVGQSRGLARVSDDAGGTYEITGVVAHGATGIIISLEDGSNVQPTLLGVGSAEYPFFDVTVSSRPAGFNTLGTTPPAPCAAT